MSSINYLFNKAEKKLDTLHYVSL